jgi:tetrahydromethanopterin S-methyltransferase subunit G
METVSASQIGAFIGCLVVLAGLALTIKRLFTREPPLHREYASRDDHRQLSARVDNIEELIRDGFEKIDQKRSKSVAGIYDEIREMNTRLAQTSEKANLTYAHLQTIDTKMDQVLQKLPR